MKPTRTQKLFARVWPLQVLFIVLFVGWPLFFAYVLAGLLAHVYEPVSEIWNLVRIIFYVVIGLFLSFLLAVVVASVLAGIFWPLLRPLYKSRCLKNGAPFRVGDHVRVLAGPHKDRVVRVYSEWKGGSVRVELGEREKQKFKDIFDPIQLLREDVELNAAPNGGPVG